MGEIWFPCDGGNLNKRVGGDLAVITTRGGPSWRRDDRPRRIRLKFTAHPPRVTLLSARLTSDPGYNHGCNYNVRPDEYEYRLRSFLADYFRNRRKNYSSYEGKIGLDSTTIPFPSFISSDEGTRCKGIVLAIKFSRFSSEWNSGQRERRSGIRIPFRSSSSWIVDLKKTIRTLC